MKRKIWLHHLLGALFAFGLSVSAVGCLITGFDLPITSMGVLILSCGIFSLASALLFRLKFGGSLLLSLSVLAAVCLWRYGALWEQLQTLLMTVTSQYHKVYNWPALGANAADTVDLPLSVLAWWIALSVSFCVCRRKPVLLALPPMVLPLVACLIVTHTVPDEIYLYLLILGVALLLLTDWVRRNKPAQSISLTLRMAIPVAAALAALFALNPQDGYINNAAKLQKEAVNWFQQLQSITEDVTIGIGTDAASGERLNLRTVGPKSNLSYTVMRVNSPVDGTLYLRGQDYDTYTGTGWESSRDRNEAFTPGGKSAGKLTITTYGTRNLLYVPYYAAEEIQLNGGCVENVDNQTTYSYELSLSPAGSQFSSEDVIWGGNIQVNYDFNADEDSNLKLGSCRVWAEPLAQEITAGCGTQEEMVRAIGDYVRDSASYDLATSRMSADSDDFALWFLEESDTGYCVHFATAATVLLRAAGIPARYVEGYMISCRAREPTVVSNQSAHAWAEYYDSGAWKVLEATPPDANAEPETQAPSPTEPMETEPPETQIETTGPSENIETPTTSTPGTAVPTPQNTPFKLPGWVKTLLWILLAAAAVVLQGKLRISYKRTLWNRGEPNEMALVRWMQSEQLARLLKIPLPEDLDALAQKAKFSQHTLTNEELQQFEHYRRDALRVINEQSLFRKLFLRWILAVG